MWFASPLWLIALVPWGGMTVWLLWGRYQRAQVPYLALWRGAMEERPKRAGLRQPPLSLLFAIVAILLGVIAGAKPQIWGTAYRGDPLQVIVDRGLTMSISEHGAPRFRIAVKRFADELKRRMPGVPIELTTVPGKIDRMTEPVGVEAVANALPGTGVQTDAMLDRIVAGALRSGDDAVVVLSDQPMQIEAEAASARVIRIAPESAVSDVGISLIAARETPAMQIMVQVLNQSSQRTGRIDLVSSGQRLREEVQLPTSGASRNYFFTPAELGETIQATVVPGDFQAAEGLPADASAWIARVSRWPAIESHISLDPAVERMISVYSRKRPPVQGSETIDIVADSEDLSGKQRGIVVAQSFADAATTGSSLGVGDHPITRGISWGELPLLPASGEPPAGWETLVSSGSKTILAAQAEPVRKVWVGFATDQWSTQSQFVIFWSNVFDWVGQGGRQFSASPLGERSKDWAPLSSPEGFPGICQREDGARRAFNTLAEPLPPAQHSTADWPERLTTIARRKGGRSIAGDVALSALFFLLCSLAAWRRRPAIASDAPLSNINAALRVAADPNG
jgi:hypothetical protein